MFSASHVLLLTLTSCSVSFVRSAALPGETDCLPEASENFQNLYDLFSSSIQGVTNHSDSHPALSQFEVYKRSTQQDAPIDCDVIALEPFVAAPTRKPSTHICPIKYVCKQDFNRYPSVYYEAVCVNFLGRYGAFQCANNTYTIQVLKKIACDTDGQTTKWIWENESIKTGCYVTNAQRGYHTILQRLETVMTANMRG